MTSHEIAIIRKIKRPEGMIRWPTYVIAEDTHGLWLFSPKGTICRGQTRSETIENEVGRGNRPEAVPVMHLIPREGWWMAAWCSLGLNVEICTPPALIDNEWQFVDLELDPRMLPDGRIEIEDEDEFEAARLDGQIPEEEATEARKASDHVTRAMRNSIEPFGQVGWTRLEEAINLALEPIRDLSCVAYTP